jgi:hypothetical protein
MVLSSHDPFVKIGLFPAELEETRRFLIADFVDLS